MKTNIFDHVETKTAESITKTGLKWSTFLLFLISVALGAAGCGEGYYSTSPGYAYPGYGPYYGGYGPYGPSYGPGYAAYPGSVTVEVGDRPYYNRGAGYYVGHTYYVWRPGHWASRGGQRVWIHGHYVLR